MKNKKIVIILSILVLCILSLIITLKLTTKSKEGTVIATSKIGDITDNDMNEYITTLENTFGQKIDTNLLKKEDKQLIINEIVNNKVILNKAKKSKIKSSKVYKEKVKQLEDALLKEMFLQELVNKNITEEKIKERYDEVNSVLKDKKEYKVKHIVVKTEEEIKQVIKELRKDTFEEVAEKYSIDDSKNVGGDLGYVIEGQTVKEFDDVLKQQPVNKLSEPFKTQFGWHVLIKEDERNATIADFESTKSSVKDALIRDFMREYGLNNIKDLNIVVLDGETVSK